MFDWDGNNVYIHVYEGREKVFTYFDNDTKSFKFYDQVIMPEWEGQYKVEILIGDDHWLGSLTETYTLRFYIGEPPETITIPA